MEKFSADAFLTIAKFLADLRARLVRMGQSEFTVDRMTEGSAAHNTLTAVRGLCEKVGLRVSMKCVDHMIWEAQKDEPTVGTLTAAITQVERTIKWEMEDKLFMYIPPERAQRYDLAEPFGADVAKNFTSATFDLKEAGNCFASGRFTACVSHLMRALEIGLVVFAKLFPAVPTNKENWQQIIEKIESEIREMPKAVAKAPDWKEKQEKYSQLANSFMFFKDAWRNYTAHARGKYTEDEADAIYRNVRSFMQGLVTTGLTE